MYYSLRKSGPKFIRKVVYSYQEIRKCHHCNYSIAGLPSSGPNMQCLARQTKIQGRFLDKDQVKITDSPVELFNLVVTGQVNHNTIIVDSALSQRFRQN